MDTFFASPERTGSALLSKEVEAVSKNPVVSGLLRSISGLLAILDENRQIVAFNDSFLRMVCIDDPEKILGLRPGEALNCIYSDDGPSGCGTTKFCSTCGAAISIVASLGEDKPVERLCALSINRGGSVLDMVLLVKSQPILIDNRKFLLLFLQDVTVQEKRASLERTFFHDVNNMLSMLINASQILFDEQPSDLSAAIYQSTNRLIREVAIQRSLSESSAHSYQPIWSELTVEQIMTDLETFFITHPAARDKNIDFSASDEDLKIKTDISLLLRILCNMITNALEATEEGGTIRVTAVERDGALYFSTWNPRSIPKNVKNRIFQRNFSTKAGAGRGVGTYAMKLFGETILGGKVSFTSSKEEGTTFTFEHPL